MWALSVFSLLTSGLQAERYAFAATDSSLSVFVPRAGLLKVLGHDHTIVVRQFDGLLVFDPADPESTRIEVRVPARALSVVDEGVSQETRAKIEEEMRGQQVLQQADHPEIVFESTEINIGQPGSWTVLGSLTIRGQTRPVTFPVEVQFPTPYRLEASGVVKLKPEDFGIKPVSALGGAVRTARTIEIPFKVVGLKEKG